MVEWWAAWPGEACAGLCGCLLAGHHAAGGSGGHGQTAMAPRFATVCSGVLNRQGRLGGLPPCFGHPRAPLPPASAQLCAFSLSCSGDTHVLLYPLSAAWVYQLASNPAVLLSWVLVSLGGDVTSFQLTLRNGMSCV